MNKLIAAMAFATLIASPAFAQSYDPDLGSGNIVRVPQMVAPAPRLRLDLGARAAFMGARGAFAQVSGGAPAIYSPYRSGVASDPDPNIRFQLNRESLQGRW